jgi:hypothetical protein
LESRHAVVCAAKQAPGSLGTESGVNFLYTPGLSSFDMAIQKEFSLAKEGKARLQLRFDAFNVFNHANFTGLNTTLNLQSYPTIAGMITGSPAITATALGRNANGSFNTAGFGTVTQPGPGAPGYSRILQTIIRIRF